MAGDFLLQSAAACAALDRRMLFPPPGKNRCGNARQIPNAVAKRVFVGAGWDDAMGDRLLHAVKSNPTEMTPFAIGPDIYIDLPSDVVHLISKINA